MAAVPHFDMKPGERLKPLREIKLDAGALLGPKYRAATGRRRYACFSRAQSDQDLSTAESGWFGPAQGPNAPAPSTM